MNSPLFLPRKYAFQLVLIVFGIVATVGFAQAQEDSPSFISSESVFGGYKYYQNGQRLDLDELLFAVRTDEVVHAQIQKTKAPRYGAYVLSYGGGFLIGYEIGSAIAGGEPNWKRFGLGVGTTILAFTIEHQLNLTIKQAVDTFNGGLAPIPEGDKQELTLGVSGDGVGLRLSF